MLKKQKINSIKFIIETSIFISSFIFSYYLRSKTGFNLSGNLKLLLFVTVLSSIIVYSTKSYKKSWSYGGVLDFFYIGVNVIIFNLFYITFIFILYSRVPIKFVIINGSISSILFLMLRFAARVNVLINMRGQTGAKKVLIVGAGSAADGLIREIMKNKNMKYHIVGLIDDDKKKSKLIVHGKKVLGDRFDIPRVIDDHGVEEVIIAMPSANSKAVEEIYNLSNQINVDVKILPNYLDILETKSFVSQVRDVEVEDLLGRDVIDINNQLVSKNIEGKVVLITGGAGSIGSELSRQIAKYNPKLLINVDINENSLYFLELELKRKYINISLVSEICNIREKNKLEHLFDKYRPDYVFHAAAHKHVPLMEHNPEEAIKNNIFGTKNVVELANKYYVQRFVLVSTDKAVNPTNIMGATKRAAELIVEEYSKTSKTKFMAVRFGNVLGSNGSVIPIFKQLIKEKKNLTITHEEITRYFMTIPEASQLVIEAGISGNGGEVFILDMGEPVKIVDLAKNLIKLSGLTLGLDIDIEIVGLRPGEKLYEELLYDVKSAIKTDNKKIFIAKLKRENIELDFHLSNLNNAIQLNKFSCLKDLTKKFITTYKEPKHHNGSS